VTPGDSASGPARGAWLADCGGVTVGTTFQTGLYLGDAVRGLSVRCTVEVVFDPRMLYCVALEPPPAGGPPVSQDATIASGRVEITLVLPHDGHAPARPAAATGAGILVATLRWRCVGEGSTDVFVRVRDPDGHAPSCLRIMQRPRA
jgi:hypothetical protein